MIITICGSKKFANDIYLFANILRSLGNTVYTPMFNTNLHINDLIQAHRYKIVASDLIIIYNLNGYIGEHTRDEINFAKSVNKVVLYTDDIGDLCNG